MTCKDGRFNTGNPICSNKPQDLHDNAMIIDAFTNSDADFVEDRFGVERKTIAGIEKEANNTINGFGDLITQRINEKIIAQGGVEIINNWDQASDENVFSAKFLTSIVSFGFKVVKTISELRDALNSGVTKLYVTSDTDVFEVDRGITINQDNTTIIFDPTVKIVDSLSRGSSISARGTLGSEVKLTSNATAGDYSLTVESVAGLNVGDWVYLKSQRACAHSDATDAWQLGETTANTLSPFFAEPLQIESIDDNELTFTSPLLFPDYRTDKLEESYSNARESSTIQKINFLKNIHIECDAEYVKDTFSVIDAQLLLNSKISFSNASTVGRGVFIAHRKCLNSEFNLKHSRPSNWVLEGDHSGYNSMKDIGSWYCKSVLHDVNGCQGFDQAYTDNPTIGMDVYVNALSNREDAATTHGNSYRGYIKVVANDCKLTGLRNRSRFFRGEVYADGGISALALSSWGGHDVEFKVRANRCGHGIRLLHRGVTQESPPFKNSRFDLESLNTVSTSFYVEDVNTEIFTKNLESGIVVTNLKSDGGSIRSIYLGAYVNSVKFRNVEITNPPLDTSPCYFRLGGGHVLNNCKVDMSKNTTANTPLIFGNALNVSDAAGLFPSSLTLRDVSVVNGIILDGNDRLIAEHINASAVNSNFVIIIPPYLTSSNLMQVNVIQNYMKNAVRFGLGKTISPEVVRIIVNPSENIASKSIGLYSLDGVDVVASGVGVAGVTLDISTKRLLNVFRSGNTVFITSL